MYHINYHSNFADLKDHYDFVAFSSLDPVIPAECRSLFLFHGVELPGYRYEPTEDEAPSPDTWAAVGRGRRRNGVESHHTPLL